MKKITRAELIERSNKSHPYPVGDEALQSYYHFFEQYSSIHEVRVLVTLMKLNEVDFEGHRLVIFDTSKLQRAYQEMGEVIPEEFAKFLFEQ
ncbi:hypothetical protein [Dubosiella newyorkensis]|uniref:Uncharacterized protein n=1 Tax=Dubosiella newyorkensis TaxID=1862672 RepID=A0A1U7NQ09_9FIRM|nr:hypothetical protein [Dubosiella newyorkensis]OLU47718.1 hypothetical protein BO225_02435 [Dubosiella newyorkensis]